jgi:hypothetical protein
MEYLEIISDGKNLNMIVTSSIALSIEEKFLINEIFYKSGMRFYYCVDSEYDGRVLFGKSELVHLSIECETREILFKELRSRYDEYKKLTNKYKKY